jgi:hypothetical protein
MPITGAEADRLRQNYQQGATRSWLAWGPYLSERQWGTVREDYSPGGNAWEYFPHDQARSRAYRWGEDGLAGICDRAQRLCFALALWNGRDPIVKERLFGLTNDEGNHGEDVKEYYFYLDNTPTHSYMKWLYKYPQAPYPYADLVEENARRKRTDGHASEYELMDTGVFADNRYFDVQVEYAKAAADDILCRITVTNRGPDAAELHVLPTLWFRNTWSWFTDAHKPVIQGKLTEGQNGQGQIGAMQATGPEGDAAVMPMTLYCQAPDELLFVENDSNARRLWESPDSPPYPKDGINDHVVSGAATVNPELSGTKAAAHYRLHVAGGASAVIRLRLSADAAKAAPFGADFDATFATRLAEADEFYTAVGPAGLSDDRRLIQRQAYAGMLWGKQTYCYVVRDWLTGDPAGPPPPPQRDRNKSWMHFYAEDVISMPDKWEYPWFASWDLCFQSVVLARLDPQFAKEQLLNLLHEFYMSPDGGVPAYEWAFSDVNPPLQAWAALRVFDIDKQVNGGDGDAAFLAEILRYSLMYFTWWTNRKDPSEKDLFEGGFLGLDNIAVIDRSHLEGLEAQLGTKVDIYQSDGTSWMGLFSLHLMEISLQLAANGHQEYAPLAAKFLQHFVFIADALNKGIERRSDGQVSVWDDDDGFFYDVLHVDGPSEDFILLRLRSLVGIIALFPVTSLDLADIEKYTSAEIDGRLEWFRRQHEDLLKTVLTVSTTDGDSRMLSFVTPDRLRRMLSRVLDESEFLGSHGVRGISRAYAENPFRVDVHGVELSEQYEPAESSLGMFGGNSNWRGPVWFPINFLLVETLRRYHDFLGDAYTVEHPTGSGRQRTLGEVADDLAERLIGIFERGADGTRPVYGGTETFQQDPHWRDLILFYEYFHGDNGAGVGASHQTGWTGLVAELLRG